MKKKIAFYISYISRPPVVAIVGFSLLIYMIHVSFPFLFFGITTLFAGVIPFITVRMFTDKEFMKSLNVEREERKKPFLIGITSYFSGFLLLSFLNAPAILTVCMLCYFLNTIIMAFINRYWKISIHASGIAGPTTAIVYYIHRFYIAPILILIIPVCWSRIFLKAHTRMQVIAGALLSIFLAWIQFSIFLPSF